MGFQKLIELRKSNEEFSCGSLRVIPTGNDHVLAYSRDNILVFTNFSESLQEVPHHILAESLGTGSAKIHGLSEYSQEVDLGIEPLDFLVIRQQS